MGVYNAAGTRITRSTMPTAALDAPGDPVLKVTSDLWQTVPTGRDDSGPAGGSVKVLLRAAGQSIRQSEIDALFPTATITSLSVVTGSTAGGTVVTLTGTDLDGVTSVTFGGTAGTALTVLSTTQVRVTTPAHTAGLVAVAAVDDAGTVTKTGAFTYA